MSTIGKIYLVLGKIDTKYKEVAKSIIILTLVFFSLISKLDIFPFSERQEVD